MKTRLLFTLMLVSANLAYSQGTLVFDQQSSDETRVLEGGVGSPGQSPAQSFTPALPGMDFVQLWILLGDQGQRLAVNLRSESPSGPILGTSAVVEVPTQSFIGALTFVFPTRIALVPETSYYFEPFPVGGGGFRLNQSGYQYPRGVLYANGRADPFPDMWFREGILVPEPGTATLVLIGAAIAALRRHRT